MRRARTPAFALTLAIAAVLAAAAPRPARAGAAPTLPPPAPEREVTVINRARQPINQVYVSPSQDNDWGTDRLADGTLDAGQSLHLKLGRGHDCTFDLQAVFDDGSKQETHGADLCRQHAVTFDGAGAVPPPSQTAQHSVTLLNRSPRPVQQVFISPADAADWGDDRLAKGAISVGDSFAVAFRGDCVADLRVVFDNRSAEERRGIDLCTVRRIAVAPGWTTADAVPTEADPGVADVPLHVRNRTGHAAVGLFLYPAGTEDRGPDLLGGSPLASQGEIDVTVSRPNGACDYAAHVVFGGKLPDADVRGLDVCRAPDIVLPPR